MESKIRNTDNGVTTIAVKASTIISTSPGTNTSNKCVRFTQAKEIEIELNNESNCKDCKDCKVDMHVIATLWDQYDHHIFSINERHYTFSSNLDDNDGTSLKFDLSNSIALEEDAPKWIVNSTVFRSEHGKLCARLKIAVEYLSFDTFGVDDLQSVEGQLLIKIRRR